MNTTHLALQTIAHGVATSDSRLSDFISNGIPLMMNLLTTIGLLAAIAIAVAGVVRLLRGEGGWPMIIMALIFGGLSIVMPMALQWVSADSAAPKKTAPSPTPSEAPTSSPVPSSAPDPVQHPADLSWLYITLGILLAAVLLVALIASLVFVYSKARRSIREEREQAAALRAAAERRAATWKSFRDHHEELLRKILHSETDWDSLFFTPALTDPSVPATYEMLKAMRTANTLRDTDGDLPTGLDADVDLTKLPYPRAVNDFALAWDAAERNARRLGQKGIPAAERKTIKQIRTLLDIAENAAASQSERNLAYKRAQTLINGLESITLPKRAIAQLEERHQLMLTELTDTDSKTEATIPMEASR